MVEINRIVLLIGLLGAGRESGAERKQLLLRSFTIEELERCMVMLRETKRSSLVLKFTLELREGEFLDEIQGVRPRRIEITDREIATALATVRRRPKN